MERQVEYKTYLESVNWGHRRRSVRMLIEWMRRHQNENIRSISMDDVVLGMFRDIPKCDKSFYIRHLLPAAVMDKNIYMIKELLRLKNERYGWELFMSILRGDKVVIKTIVEGYGKILHEEDICALNVACFLSKLDLGDIFDMKIIGLDRYRLYKDEKYFEFQKNLLKKSIKFAKNQYCRRIIGYESPHKLFEEVEEEEKRILNLVERGYCISNCDELLQYSRVYGMWRWGFIEYGGHLDVKI